MVYWENVFVLATIGSCLNDSVPCLYTHFEPVFTIFIIKNG